MVFRPEFYADYDYDVRYLIFSISDKTGDALYASMMHSSNYMLVNFEVLINQSTTPTVYGGSINTS